MKAFVVFTVFLSAIVAVAFGAGENALSGACYKTADVDCSPNVGKNGASTVHGKTCTSLYDGTDTVLPDLYRYTNLLITRSFQYLLMSTHFGNYIQNRAGFEKLYRKLSDSKWDDALDLIKYTTKRGGTMDFKQRAEVDTVIGSNPTHELYELQSVGRALDIEKDLAIKANEIHRRVIRNSKNFHDGEISSHLEKEFLHKQAENVRELSGHVNDLYRLLDTEDSSLSLYLFDEYLQKL